MTDTEPTQGPELPPAATQEALTWLMTFDYDTGTEAERRHALAVIESWLTDSNRTVTISDIMAPHRGGAVRNPATFGREWSAEKPTPAAALPRALWPVVRELKRVMLMRAGLRLAALAAVDNDEVTVAQCGEAAARIFAVLDEAEA
jgi:hypothetical protein